MTLHRKSGCPDSLCHHLARMAPKHTTLTNSSASIRDWQVRGPVRHGHSSGNLPALRDSVPGCIALPAAVPLLHWAAPWQTAHTAGCWISETEERVLSTRCTMSSDTRSLAHTPVPEPCVCLPAVSDRASSLSGCSSALSPRTPSRRVTLPSSGDYRKYRTAKPRPNSYVSLFSWRLKKRAELLPEFDYDCSSDPWLTLDAAVIGTLNRLEIGLSGVKSDNAPQKQNIQENWSQKRFSVNLNV